MIALTHHDLPYFHQESQFDFPINFNTFVSLLIIVIANSRPCLCNFGNNKLIIPSLAGPPPRPSHYEITLIICGRRQWFLDSHSVSSLNPEWARVCCKDLSTSMSIGLSKGTQTFTSVQYCGGSSVLQGIFRSVLRYSVLLRVFSTVKDVQ